MVSSSYAKVKSPCKANQARKVASDSISLKLHHLPREQVIQSVEDEAPRHAVHLPLEHMIAVSVPSGQYMS